MVFAHHVSSNYIIKKMKTFSILFALLICVSAVGQAGKLKRADKYFTVLSYTKAAIQFEELIGSAVDSPKMKSKLAYCYFQMGEMVKAETTYAQMISTPDATSDDIYNYSQTLKENKKYSESDNWMKKFTERAPEDFRTKDFLSKGDYLSRIEKDGVRFTIKNLDANTALTDFGGYPSVDEKDIYFMSSRQDKARNDDVWTWNNDFYLEMYKSQKDATLELPSVAKYSKKINTRFHEGPICFANSLLHPK
jgi:tetratricopeptide (TPR) repeat protein